MQFKHTISDSNNTVRSESRCALKLL